MSSPIRDKSTMNTNMEVDYVVSFRFATTGK